VIVYGSVDGVDKLWEADDADGWITPVTPQMVQAELDRKSGSLERGRAKCDEIWLVIVRDLAAGGAPYELSREAASAHYKGAFDRLYLLDPHGPSVHHLSKSANRRY
jgi:hypothetical protein